MSSSMPPLRTRTITRSQLQAMCPAPSSIKPEEAAALERLIAVAHQDTGQSRRVAAFLLSWWNASTCGGFDLTDLWSVDAALVQDMQIVFCMVARLHCYPDALGYGAQFRALVHTWRPHQTERIHAVP